MDISDIHVGASGVWNAGELDALVSNINAKSPNTVFVLGDITQTGYQAEKDTYDTSFGSLTGTVLEVRGNHDDMQGLDLFDEHFVHVLADITFICFYTMDGYSVTPNVGDNGVVTDEELAWLQTQLQNATTSKIVVMSHCPIYNTFSSHIDATHHQQDVMNLLKQYGVKVAIAGHSHLLGVVSVNDGISYYTGMAAKEIGEGYQVIKIYSDRLDVYRYDARTPFGLYNALPIRLWL